MRPLALYALVLLALATSGCANIHTVDDSKLYRSAQLDAEDLRALAAEHRLKSVLNLRGANLDKDWYREEVAVCQELGLVHTSISLSSRRWPRPSEILALLDAFEAGPYPMVVHCLGGADRSGLAAAIYRIAVRGEPASEASAELSLWRGHLGALRGTEELDQFLELYGRTGGGKSLRAWVTEDYERERERWLQE